MPMTSDKSIRFINSRYDELFRIPDDGSIRIEYPDHPERNHVAECEYIDDYHISVGSITWHTYQFAEVEEGQESASAGKAADRVSATATAGARKQIGTYELYQLKDGLENHYRRFESYDRLKKHGDVVNRANYNKVYSGTLYSGETLDSIYERFNLRHPADFRGHSLSVSDVIVLHQDGRNQAWYVDSFGFKQVPEFTADNPLAKVEELLEDDYGMIDGIIDNGDRKKEQEEPKKSVMDKLQEKKREAAEAEASRPKPVSRDARQEPCIS